MKKTYRQPGIKVKAMMTESPLLKESLTREVTNADGNAGIGYAGAGNGTGNSVVRTSGSNIWDDGDDDPGMGQ